MTRMFTAPTAAIVALLIGGVLQAQTGGPPSWAYNVEPRPAGAREPAPAPAPDPQTLLRVPGSSQSFTLEQIEDQYGPADWFPGDHPEMPAIVARGKRPEVQACGSCHYPNGKGRPSNGPVSGLAVEYFLQQIEDFSNGLRTSADPRKTNTNRMAAYAKALTPEEARAAAEYFGAIEWTTPWIRVVETETIPKMHVEGSIFFPLPGNETEPIGMRVVETPENPEQTEPLRNPRSGFIAYVPMGSLAKGEALVNSGGDGRTVQCDVCHGTNLEGGGNIPAIAGRSPSYIARQLYDMKAGTRHGPGAVLMESVVENLTEEDLVAIAAYVASVEP